MNTKAQQKMDAYFYSYVTKPLIASIMEARGWGITEQALTDELDFARMTAFLRHDAKEAAREAGH
jgi:hypothetical protein